MDNKQIIYFYDLPKGYLTMARIHELLKQAGAEGIQPPNIRRDPYKPFYTAVVKIDIKDFGKVIEKLKYFEMGEKTCRDGKTPGKDGKIPCKGGDDCTHLVP